MSSLAKAADDIKKLAVRLKPILELGEVLEGIGSIENAASEADRRKQDAYSAAEAAKEAQTAAEGQLAEAQQRVTDAHNEAAGVKSAAEIERVSIIQKASQEAARIIESANKQKAEANHLADDANKKLQDVNAQVEASRKALENYTKKIEEAKQKIRELIS